MMASEQQGMSPKKGKDLRKSLEHLKIWNEFICQFRLVCDYDPTILTCSPRKYLDHVLLQDEATGHTFRFPWAYPKFLVYKDRSKTLEVLRNHIRAEIDNISGRYA
ncbi:hypothetical protein TNCV_837361 [Trichonephila clavipes]|nr:hypothetical protein TNCV_837361 [Trichonephila clavipes]